jgi:hypothetical protein
VTPPTIPGAATASDRLARRPLPRPRLTRGSASLTFVAAGVLAVSVVALGNLGVPGGDAARGWHGVGTAAMATATCGDWQDAGEARRGTMISSLGIAATRPDPENPGATLSEGQAYLILNRVCSTELSRSFLLYPIYNRAAVFH